MKISDGMPAGYLFLDVLRLFLRKPIDAVVPKQRYSQALDRCGIMSCSEYRQSSSGRRVWRRNSTQTAFSTHERPVAHEFLDPVGTSSTKSCHFHLCTVFLLMPHFRDSVLMLASLSYISRRAISVILSVHAISGT